MNRPKGFNNIMTTSDIRALKRKEALVKWSEKKAKRADKLKTLARHDLDASKSLNNAQEGPSSPPRARKPRKISRKGLVRKADHIFSLYIRSLSKVCWSTNLYPIPKWCNGKVENCFHFLTRSKRSIRWDRRNAAGSCAPCNILYEQDADFISRVVSKYKDLYGTEQWDDLVRLGNIPAKHSDADLQEIIKKFSCNK